MGNMKSLIEITGGAGGLMQFTNDNLHVATEQGVLRKGRFNELILIVCSKIIMKHVSIILKKKVLIISILFCLSQYTDNMRIVTKRKMLNEKFDN